MNIYIMRHGYSDNGFPDAERILSSMGREKIKSNLSLIKTHIPSLEYVVTSPLKRAYQTAELIHKLLNVDSKLITESALAPGASIAESLLLAKSLEANSVLLVGHMPDVSQLTLNLIDSEIIDLPFSPGAIAGIKFQDEIREASGELKFMLPLE